MESKGTCVATKQLASGRSFDHRSRNQHNYNRRHRTENARRITVEKRIMMQKMKFERPTHARTNPTKAARDAITAIRVGTIFG